MHEATANNNLFEVWLYNFDLSRQLKKAMSVYICITHEYTTGKQAKSGPPVRHAPKPNPTEGINDVIRENAVFKKTAFWGKALGRLEKRCI